jgi:hypothetical protein
MGLNYFKSSNKTMVETVNRPAAPGPVFCNRKAQGKITAFGF